MIFFTSDAHFCHEKIIEYCFRPFNSVDEMNEKMIDNWNSVVDSRDTVYVLGDFILSNDKKEVAYILNSLNGKLVLITGDHDKSCTQIYPKRFSSIQSFLKLKAMEEYGTPDISLFHYCMKVWPKSHYNAWSLFGHSHGKLKGDGKSCDVGVDCNQFTPLSIVEICEIMKLKGDNFNFIKEKPKKLKLLEQIKMNFTW